jgi:hypothetical protein
MQFNNYFNFGRFARLFRQNLLINKTKYLLTIIGLGLITYLMSYWFLDSGKDFLIQNENYIANRYAICFVFYMIAVAVVIGTAFPDLADKIKASHYLLSPGSTFEKLMVQFMLRIGLFVPIALGVFWITIRLAKASLTPGESGLDPSIIPYFDFRFLITNYNNEIWHVWQICFFIFGFFSYGTFLFAGTTYFRRYALIKSVIVSAVVLGISILFSMLLSNIFYSQNRFFDIKLEEFHVTEHLDSFKLFALLLSLLSWMFFLAIGYFKLKEKEA